MLDFNSVPPVAIPTGGDLNQQRDAIRADLLARHLPGGIRIIPKFDDIQERWTLRVERMHHGNLKVSVIDAEFVDGPDYAVLCSGEWTGWHEERYEGATLNDALRAAADAKSSRLPENYPPRVQQTAGLAIDAGVGSGKFTATNQPPLSAVLRVKDDKNV